MNQLHFFQKVKHINFISSQKPSQCACLKTNDFLWKECDCGEKQHFMCRKIIKKHAQNSNVFKTANDLNENIEREDESIGPIKEPPILSHLILTVNSTPTTRETMHYDIELVAKPEALPFKSNDESNSAENVEDMEKDLMSLANYLLSKDFNKLFLNSTSYENDDETTQDEVGDNIAVKKLVNDALNNQLDTKTSQHHSKNELVLVKIELLKDTSIYEENCPHGFGYYSNNDHDCRQYKKCENSSRHYALITLYKCLDEQQFDFKELKCVFKTDKCEVSELVFVSL